MGYIRNKGSKSFATKPKKGEIYVNANKILKSYYTKKCLLNNFPKLNEQFCYGIKLQLSNEMRTFMSSSRRLHFLEANRDGCR